MFAFTFDRYNRDASATDPEPNGGVLDLGFTNPDHYQGSINYVPLVQQGVWKIALDAFMMNGQNVPVETENGANHAVIDT